MLKLLAFLAIFYAVLCAGMFFFQRKLMYFPYAARPSFSACGLQCAQEIGLVSADGTKLVACHISAREHFPTIVYFHGNAGNLEFRAPRFAAFSAAGFGVLAVNYRGYGGSEGSPYEEGIMTDARTAMRYAADILKLPSSSLILYGESLGSGVAVRMAMEFPVAGIALEAPYTSVADRAAELYPFIPVRLLLRDHFHSLVHIKKVKAPLLILHGEQDRVIPARHGRALLEAANEPKRGVFYPHVDHVSFDYGEVTKELLRLVDKEMRR